MEEQGLIQAFEYNYELSWNLLKDFYEEQGETSIQGREFKQLSQTLNNIKSTKV